MAGFVVAGCVGRSELDWYFVFHIIEFMRGKNTGKPRIFLQVLCVDLSYAKML